MLTERGYSGRLIDTETGEIIEALALGEAREIVNNSNEDVTVIVNVKPNEVLKPRQKKKPPAKGGESFVMVFYEQLNAIRGKLTEAESAFLFHIQGLIDYEDGTVKVVENGRNVFMNLKRASRLMNWGETKTREVVQGLVRKRVIALFKTGREAYIIVSPLYFFRGSIAKRNAVIEKFKELFKQAERDDRVAI